MIWLKRALVLVAGDTLIALVIAALRGAQVAPNLAPLYLLAVDVLRGHLGLVDRAGRRRAGVPGLRLLLRRAALHLHHPRPPGVAGAAVFLVVAAVTSNLAARERARREQARRRRRPPRCSTT